MCIDHTYACLPGGHKLNAERSDIQCAHPARLLMGGRYFLTRSTVVAAVNFELGTDKGRTRYHDACIPVGVMDNGVCNADHELPVKESQWWGLAPHRP